MKLVRLDVYESPARKFSSYNCGAKDTADARRCEGFEYANMSNDPKKVNCKHRDIFGDGCNKYTPYKAEEPKKGAKQ